jgi:citrate lyase subunit beta/citryl-CoA lyase
LIEKHTMFRPRRSVLYMPGSSTRVLEKARKLPADSLIFDLEDSVAPDAKLFAREQVLAAVKSGGYGSRELIIRVNAPETPWGKDDLAAAALAEPDAVLIPKVVSPGDIMQAAKVLRDSGAKEHVKLWAMMETPNAILNADSILRTAADPASRFCVIVMGTNDIARETRARLTPGRVSMLTWLSLCVAAARAYSVEILDGVFNDFSDEIGFRAECEQGHDLGMDGKTLIHPNQLAICNEVFMPAAEEIAWAKRIVLAFADPENTAKNVLQVEGRMVERLHEEMARRTLKIAEAIALSSKSDEISA